MSEPDAPPPWAAALTSTLQQVVEEQSALRQRLDELAVSPPSPSPSTPSLRTSASPAACRQSMGDQLPAKPAIESSLGHEDQDEEEDDPWADKTTELSFSGAAANSQQQDRVGDAGAEDSSDEDNEAAPDKMEVDNDQDRKIR